jgi:WD40 repeat protein
VNEPQRNEPDERALDALIVAALRQEDRDDQTPTVERLPPLNDGEQVAVQGVEPARAEVRTEVLPAPNPETMRATGTAPGPRIEGFEILRELGRGGMSVVYLAQQLRPNRLVALKMIRAGDQADEAELARFRLEAETLARLRHPNIVQIHVVGEHEGRPFLALEFIAGGTLADKVREELPSPTAAAEQLVTLAQATHAAHERGVIHRDLKPENVLLDPDGALKITDFGLAKKLDAVGQTASNAVVGTPSYMAPEQAGGKSRLVGPAADIYALGAILYKLLTGRPPFQGPVVMDVLMQVVSEEPVPPRRLRPQVPRDLQTICLKCLAKSPGDRYADARDLAEDLRRFRAGEPIAARPVRRGERLAKWARRRPALAAAYLLCVLALGLAGGGASAVWLWQRAATVAEQLAAEKQQTETALEGEQRAKAREAEARQEIALLSCLRTVELAHRYWREDELAGAERLLQGCPVPLRGWEWYYVRHLCRANLHTLKGHSDRVTGVAFCPDGSRLASASWDGTVKVWDVQSGQEVLTLRGHRGWVSGVAFSPDGRRLASAGGVTVGPGEVKVWDAQTGQEVLTFQGHAGSVLGVAFSPDGHRLASASWDGVKVWDAQSGQEVLTLRDHRGWVSGVAFSPDGRRLASAGGADREPGDVKVWDAQTGREIRTLKGHTDLVYGVAFSPDGHRLASAGGRSDKSGEVKVWDGQTGQEERTLIGHTHPVLGVAFSPDGRRLASASQDRTVKVWDAQTGQEVVTLKQHTRAVQGVAFSPDGRRLASASMDRTVKLWDAQGGQEALTLKAHTDAVTSVAFSPDGRRLASASQDRTVKVWDAQTVQVLRTLEGHTGSAYGVSFSPDGGRLASASWDKTVKVWDAQTGQATLTLQGHTGEVNGVAFSPDGHRLASASMDETVKVWDAQTGQEIRTLGGHSGPVYGVAFSPDGGRLASASQDRTVKLWDAQTGQEAFTLKGHTDAVTGVAFSPDGRILSSASVDRTVKVWDAQTGQEISSLRGHTLTVQSVCFSPDGRRLASASEDKTVKVWDVRSGQEAFTLKGHSHWVSSAAFSPDGQRLASASRDGTVKVWDATPLPGDSEPPATDKP